MDNKQLANWIFWEDENNYYCSECIEKKLEEINKNKEFAEYIDYAGGDKCGYFQDYANDDDEVVCCTCFTPLFSLVDC